MPVAFLSGDEAAAHERHKAVPSQAELDKIFFLDFSHRPRVYATRWTRRVIDPAGLVTYREFRVHGDLRGCWLAARPYEG
jgi:hypothetical protein